MVFYLTHTKMEKKKNKVKNQIVNIESLQDESNIEEYCEQYHYNFNQSDLGKGTFWMINQDLLLLFRNIELVLYITEVVYRSNFANMKGFKDIQGYFHFTKDSIYDKTSISHEKQDEYIKFLTDNEFMETKTFGHSTKMYYRFDAEKLSIVLFQLRKEREKSN